MRFLRNTLLSGLGVAVVGACAVPAADSTDEETRSASSAFESPPAASIHADLGDPSRGAPPTAFHGRLSSANLETPSLTPTPSSVTTFTNHGGPVMTGTTNVYYIWYGNWAGNSATSILTDLAKSIGGSTYWAINTQYPDNNGNRPANSVVFAGSTSDSYSKGKSLAESDIQSIVSSAIKSKKLPSDSNGVYFVLTSSDVAHSDFCTKMCGYHDHFSVNGADIKYSFIGDSSRCTSTCAASQNRTGSPNGNVGADAMATVIAHELEETVTDPDLNGWYGASLSEENGDACVWTFGDTYPSGGGSANMHLGGRDYLIQRNLIPVGTPSCGLELHYSHAAASTGPSARGDFDGDGIADVLWRNERTGDVSVWLMSANGTPRQTLLAYSGIAPEWQINGAADFDGDGKTDILWRNVQSGMVSTWTMNGATPTAFNVVHSGIASEWQIAGTGDFDGDGKGDILWHDVVNGDVSIWPMNGATATAYLLIWSGVGLDWQVVGTGDFDGDGIADILWRNAKTGDISTWQMKNNQPTFTVPKSGLGANIDIAAIGDINGDGRSDVILHDTSNGNVSAWLMNGGTISSTPSLYTGVGLEWRIYGAADMTGDHTADILWRDARNGDVSVWLMQNAAPTQFVLSYSGVGLDWKIMAE
jgi:hypothetical protein